MIFQVKYVTLFRVFVARVITHWYILHRQLMQAAKLHASAWIGKSVRIFCWSRYNLFSKLDKEL